jgi:hypothetical protein
MKPFALALALLLPFACAAADGLIKRDFRVGLGGEFIHERWTGAMTVKYGAAQGFFWHNNHGLGLTWDFGELKRRGFNAGVGGVVIRETNGSVGTHLNFLFRGSYCRTRWCLSVAHISHGSDLGIRQDKENDGLNFLFLEYRL